MTGFTSLAAAVWQEPIVGSQHDLHLIMYFTGVIAVAFALMGISMLVVAIYGYALTKKVEAITAKLQDQITPILTKTNALVTDLTPKVNAVTSNVEQISYAIRAKVDELGVTVSELNETVKDLNGKTKAQVRRVDGLVTEALTTTQHVSHSVQEGIKAPIRQISGIVAGVKAGIETLIARSPFPKRTPGPYDL